MTKHSTLRLKTETHQAIKAMAASKGKTMTKFLDSFVGGESMTIQDLTNNPDIQITVWHQLLGQILLKSTEEVQLYMSSSDEFIANYYGTSVAKVREAESLGLYWSQMEKFISGASLNPENTHKQEAKDGFIYIVKELSEGHYKIGRTIDIDSRMRTFSIKLPFKIEIIHTFECHDYFSAEKALHDYFDTERVNGEWFSLSDKDIESISNGELAKHLSIEVIE